MAIKKLVLITPIDNTEYIIEKANEFNVTIHRSYKTEGRSENGTYEAIAFVVSGKGVSNLLYELNNLDDFGY